MTSTAFTSTARIPVPEDAHLEREAERDLIARAQGGDQVARDRLVTAHLRFVVAAARRSARGGAALDDLVHEGVLGLLEAIDRFDLGRDVRFSTYAGYWVRERVQSHAFTYRRMVGAPSTRAARTVMRGYRRTSRSLEGALGRAPTRTEIAEALGLPEREVASCEPALFQGDRAVGSDDGTGVFVEPVSELPSPEAEFAEAEERSVRRLRVSDALARLSVRERRVVEQRFLADADDEESLVDVGRELGVSRERARQIQESARGKLRLSLCA